MALNDVERKTYANAELREKSHIAAAALAKQDVVADLIKMHRGESILVIGQYLDQLDRIAKSINAPLISGAMKTRDRDLLYNKFRNGEVQILVVSKVANFSVDLPDASVAIQVSGTFGSRQEEAQRLGRIMRPKQEGQLAHFYTVVTKETKDQDFALSRQRFLTEQGYHYDIMDAAELLVEEVH